MGRIVQYVDISGIIGEPTLLLVNCKWKFINFLLASVQKVYELITNDETRDDNNNRRVTRARDTNNEMRAKPHKAL